MNKAGDYIEDLKFDGEHKFEDCDFCLTEDEAEKAINLALEQVREEAKEKSELVGSKGLSAEVIYIPDLDKIINKLKL